MITFNDEDELKDILEKFVPIRHILVTFSKEPIYDNVYKIVVCPRFSDDEGSSKSIEINFDDEFLTPAGYHFNIGNLQDDINSFISNGGHRANDLAFSCDTVHTLIETIQELQKQLELEKGNHIRFDCRSIVEQGCSSYIERGSSYFDGDVHSDFINSPENDPTLDEKYNRLNFDKESRRIRSDTGL